MKLRFLGGAMEVGKSCVHMDMSETDVIFDCGIKLTEPPTYPIPCDNVDVAFLSHAHLDHCGFLPALHRQHKMPLYATPVSFELSRMLQADSLKISKLKGYPLVYNEADMARLGQGQISADYGRTYRFHDKLEFEFFDAGHIPGSAGILVKDDKQSVFYTGDTNVNPTRLLEPAVYPDHADVVISESTYGARDHPPRRDVENAFLEEVEATLSRGGVALVPVFAIGRTQEILHVLRDLDYPLYIDGMAKRATSTILGFPDTLKNPQKLQEVFDSSIWVKNRSHRKKISKEPCIIVTTAGMLAGGPVLDYLNHLYKDPNSSILLTGYQVEDTNGRLLIEKGYVIDEESQKKFEVDMVVRQFDFSAHSGKDDLSKSIKKMNPEHVVLMHGDVESIDVLKGEFGSEQVHTPELGETISID